MVTHYTISKRIGGYALDIKEFGAWVFLFKGTNKKKLIEYAKNKYPEASLI